MTIDFTSGNCASTLRTIYSENFSAILNGYQPCGGGKPTTDPPDSLPIFNKTEIGLEAEQGKVLGAYSRSFLNLPYAIHLAHCTIKK